MDEADTRPSRMRDPVIDADQFDGLVAAAGVAGARDILRAFWRSTDALIASLKRQLASGEFAAAARTAHALKGSALNVGAVRLSASIRSIEDALRSADASAAIENVPAAEEDYAATAAAFEKKLAAA